MPAPKIIAEAERDVHRATLAARNLGSTATPGLESAEQILAEVRHFAYTVADSEIVPLYAASRLMSAILGLKVEAEGIAVDPVGIKAYARLAR